jgi:hypothetical protein
MPLFNVLNAFVVIPALWWLLAACSASASQRTQPTLPECPAAALKANLAFRNDPPDENTVAINYRSASESACAQGRAANAHTPVKSDS